MIRWYPDLHASITVTLVEASGHILGTFHNKIADYVEKIFKNRDIKVMKKISVKEVRDNVAILSNGQELPFGLMVWSTGVNQIKFIRDMQGVSKTKNGRIEVDSKLRLLVEGDSKEPIANGNVYALGDCACYYKKPLPQLA